jgi:hypothetical protein
MAKDMVGNEMKVNEVVMFNNMIYTIKDLQENRIIGGHKTGPQSMQAMKIPDMITLEITLPFDAEKPFNGVMIKTPPEQHNKGNA